MSTRHDGNYPNVKFTFPIQAVSVRVHLPPTMTTLYITIVIPPLAPRIPQQDIRTNHHRLQVPAQPHIRTWRLSQSKKSKLITLLYLAIFAELRYLSCTTRFN